MARYARRLEPNEVARKAREGAPDAEIVAAPQKALEEFWVAKTMARLFLVSEDNKVAKAISAELTSLDSYPTRLRHRGRTQQPTPHA